MSGCADQRHVQARFAAVLVDEWLRAGVSDAVVAPGSRSTPLLVALAEVAEAGRLRLHVVLDERAAAYFALGLALADGRPAVVVTTSGTAAVELHPAVVEADRSNVPLLAVTADRPPELHDCGAPQTVPQLGIFRPSTRWEAAPGVADASAAWSWRAVASRAVSEALGASGRPGPVHLNLAMREPLLGDAESAADLGGPGRERGAPWHRTPPVVASWSQAHDDAVSLLAGAGERGLVVAGARGASAQAVRRLSAATGWPVLADPLSGCREPGTIATADTLLRNGPLRDWYPDVVLRVGAPWASRVVNEWLGSLDCPQVLLQRWPEFAAADRRQAFSVSGEPDRFCDAVAARASQPAGGWAHRWTRAELAAQGAIDRVLGAARGISEPGLARSLMRALPDGSTLFVSSSMPVRDLEWWSAPRTGVSVLSNRGANGIDGVISTAIGVAAAVGGRGAPGYGDGGRVVALTGDLAFLYDAGALLWAAQRSICLDIVVVDNDGGGIFGFLAQATSQPASRYERLWGTPHGLDLCQVARAYGASAEELAAVGDLAGALAGARPGVRVWVARASRQQNVAAHEELHRAVQEAVRALGR